MMKKLLLLFAMTAICTSVFAQEEINDYKYILIPKIFEFQKSKDQYKLNSLTKFLFNKYGYQAYFADEELPKELKSNRCLALTTDVNDEKGNLFKTKVEIILKDCFGETVIKSMIGESRLKKFDKAYAEAVRKAFTTFKNLDYEYTPISETTKIGTEKKSIVVANKTNATDNAHLKTLNAKKYYFAVPTKDGYNIVDTENQLLMVLLPTPKKAVFLVKGRDAIIYNLHNQWIFYEKGDGFKLEKNIELKFK